MFYASKFKLCVAIFKSYFNHNIILVFSYLFQTLSWKKSLQHDLSLGELVSLAKCVFSLHNAMSFNLNVIIFIIGSREIDLFNGF